jgi:hypothetical protein
MGHWEFDEGTVHEAVGRVKGLKPLQASKSEELLPLHLLRVKSKLILEPPEQELEPSKGGFSHC